MNQFGRHAFGFGVAAAALVVASSAFAQTKTFDIPAQSATTAIPEFGRQAGVQIVAPTRELRGVQTHAVRGQLDVRDALSRLIAGTGLSVASDTGSIISLRFSRDGSNATPSATSSDEVTALPEVLVQGSRSLNADIRRSEDDTQPFVVFTADEIQLSDAVDVESFLATRLPMNAQSATASRSPGSTVANIVDLRGLGANQTLILVNGRRLASTSGIIDQTGYNQPDLNGIPLSAIGRIEVLPTSASSIYGGGATGGVINLILKQDYSGLEVRAFYSTPLDTDASVRTVEFSGGRTFLGGRTSVMVSGSWTDGTELLNIDRPFALAGRNRTLQNDPGSLIPGFTPPSGAATNFVSALQIPLTLDNGAPFGSLYGTVPTGYAGPGSDGGAGLLPGAGRYDFGLADDAFGGRISLVNTPEKYAFTTTIRHELTDNLEVFADYSINHATITTYGNGGEPLFYLAGGDAGNPFQEDVFVTFPQIGLFSETLVEREQQRFSAGLIINLPSDWRANLEYTGSRASNSMESTYPVTTPTFAPAVASGSLNIFADTSRDLSAFRSTERNLIGGPSKSSMDAWSARIAGPLFSLPAGKASISGLLEARREEAEGAPRNYFGLGLFAYYYPISQEVFSAYTELTLPLLSKEMASPFGSSAELTLSVRHDRYETIGSTPARADLPSADATPPMPNAASQELSSTDYTVSLGYSPVEAVRLRATYGTGYLPASVGQIATDTLLGAYLYNADPQRGGAFDYIGPITILSGGTPSIEPEKSETFTAGFIWSPVGSGARVSVDYVSIKKSDEIVIPDAQAILDNEALFPGRVVRGPLEANAPAGYTAGPILTFDGTAYNAQSTSVDAVDVQADYEVIHDRLGQFRAYSVLTYNLNFDRQLAEGAPVLNHVGVSGGVPEWRGTAGLDWRNGNWSAGWAAQFTARSAIYGPGASFATQQYYASQNGTVFIPDQIYHDVYLGWIGADAGLFANTSIRVGVQNVLNTEPPIIATSGTFGALTGFGDPRMRRVSISLRRQF